MTQAKSSILIIGAGSIGERHIRCFLETGRAEISVCETNPRLLETVAARYPIRGAFNSLDEALRDNHLDAALVATPAHTHIPLAQQCADHGLHVLIEKPLALCLEGVEPLRETLEARHRAGAVAFVWRGNPVWAAVHHHLKAGRWGMPLQLNLQCGQHFPMFRPAYRDIYYNNRATGGGAILDALSHLLNMGEWLAGPITHVIADADHLALPGVTVEDTVHVIARHGKAMASYSLNQHQHPNETTLLLVCTKATVCVETHHGRVSWTKTPGGKPEELRFDPVDRDTPFITQANHFIDVIESGTAPLCSLDEGVQTQRVINEVLACADTPPWRLVQNTPSTSRPAAVMEL